MKQERKLFWIKCTDKQKLKVKSDARKADMNLEDYLSRLIFGRKL